MRNFMKFNGLEIYALRFYLNFMRCLRRLDVKFLKLASQSAALNLIAYLQIAKPHSLNLDLAARNGSKQTRDRYR